MELALCKLKNKSNPPLHTLLTEEHAVTQSLNQIPLISSPAIIKTGYRSAFLASVLFCTACSDPTFAWRVDEQFRREGPIIISPYSGEDKLNKKPGFYISMRPENAAKVQAPNGAEFRKLLDEKVVQKEQMLGRELCPLGYVIIESRTLNYHGMYVDFNAECKE